MSRILTPMHPRSPFDTAPSFVELAKSYPDFARHVSLHSTIDFKDPEAVRALSTCLLQQYFNLTVRLPDDRLCPMIPNRLDYVLWIQDLLDTTTCEDGLVDGIRREATGLDIGTGASCVYPLLTCASRPHWKMYGTEIDEKSHKWATENASRNSSVMEHPITVALTDRHGPILPLDSLDIETLDFVMCNPPFYSSVDEMLSSAHAKSLPASSACTGTTTEMVYDQDGELGFAKRILGDSIVLGTRVQWYTTLFGKLASLDPFIAELRQTPGIHGNWAITQFAQGPTQRWAVGWSFRDLRPRKEVCVLRTAGLKGCSPTSPEQKLSYDTETGAVKLRDILEDLPTLNVVESPNGTITYQFCGNVWSRAWRRARARGQDVVDTNCRLAVRISVGSSEASIRWLRGTDPVMFESFCEMLRKRVHE